MPFPPGPGPSRLAFPLGFVMQSADGASETFPCRFTGSNNLGGTDSCLIFPWLRAGRRGPRSAPTSLLLPQPGSPPPPTAASPVTTTTNKQPPARSHCAGARHPALKTLGFGREGMSSPPRSAGAELCPQQKSRLLFSALFSSTPKGLTPHPEFFRHAQQEGSLRVRRYPG